MTVDDVRAALLARFDGLAPIPSWGEESFFYNPAQALPRGTYFATIKQKDGANDHSAALDRDGVFRFCFGVPPKLFEARFGPRPARPAAGGTIIGPCDFTALDTLSPHPIYGWMGWVAINNPSHASFNALMPLLDAAFKKAKASFEKRTNTG